MTMTKKEARQHKLEWNQAIAEGRVIRLDMGGFTSYPTVQMAQEKLADLIRVGLKAEIVNPSLAQL
jgi:hypothetical protein